MELPFGDLISGVFKGIGEGIGKAAGKIADWIPGRKEYKLNRKDRIKEELNALQSKTPVTAADTIKYNRLLSELKRIEGEADRIS